jgi:hypothetical protein
MNSVALEAKIAEATKRYMADTWRLDVDAFKTTQNHAWVGLASRILQVQGVAVTKGRKHGNKETTT